MVSGVRERPCSLQLMLEAELTSTVIGAAIEVRKHLGCGLLESAYHAFLCIELSKRGLTFKSQPLLPIVYDGHRVEAAYRPDLIIGDSLIVELKAVEVVLPVHSAQVLTYMRITGLRKGLLFNFNVPVLKEGIKSFVM